MADDPNWGVTGTRYALHDLASLISPTPRRFGQAEDKTLRSDERIGIAHNPRSDDRIPENL
jgi:hypothetical protein